MPSRPWHHITGLSGVLALVLVALSVFAGTTAGALGAASPVFIYWSNTSDGSGGLPVSTTISGRRLFSADWLRASSHAAIDAAERVPGLRRDLYGQPRSRGRGPDIGPVEAR